MSKSFSVADVATHKDAESGMYIIIDENVYDVAGLSSFPFRFLPSSSHIFFLVNYGANANVDAG
jgi:hypothetical protein